MSGVLRLANTGGSNGRSTIVAAASSDATFTLPSAGGTILTTDFDTIGDITWNGSNINITNADLNVNSGQLFVDESTNRVGIGTTSPQTSTHIYDENPVLRIQDISTAIADAFAGIQLAESSPGGVLGNYWQIALEGDSITSTDHLTFKDGTGERMRIDSSGRLLVGTTSVVGTSADNSYYALLTVQGAATLPNNQGQMALVRGENSDAVTLNETIGRIVFADSDAGNYALIDCAADGNAGVNNYPGRLAFFTTANGANSPTERLRIDSVGDLIQIWRNEGFIGQKYDSNYYQGFTFLGGSTRELCIDNRAGDTQASILFRNGLNAAVTEKMRIDSSGRLLVGTETGQYTTEIVSDGEANLAIRTYNNSANNFAGIRLFNARGNKSAPLISQDDDRFSDISSYGYDGAAFRQAASIRVLADGAVASGSMPGRIEFATTNPNQTTATTKLTITTTGSLVMPLGGAFYRSGASGSGISFSTNSTLPVTGEGALADNTENLGATGNRWATVYAGTGTINTSDINLKQDIDNLNDTELLVALAIKGLVKKYRFKDAVKTKSNEARIHVGVIAQEVEQVFIDAGLDPRRYGMFCEDTLEDGTKRLGVRYNELLAFVIASL